MAPAAGAVRMATAADAWSAAAYERNARFVSGLGAPVLDLLAPRPGERILDLGCGDGALTERIAAAGADVIGLDAAPDMVAAARARGLDARMGDAATLDFADEFDAVFSNAALHWMPQAGAVIAGVARALVPGGRFVGELGGHANVAAVQTALRAVLSRRGADPDLSGIWFFPTAEAYGAALAQGGLAVTEITLFPRPTPVAAGLEAWLETLAAPILARLPAPERKDAVAEIAALVGPALTDARAMVHLDYVRLRFAARRPEGAA